MSTNASLKESNSKRSALVIGSTGLTAKNLINALYDTTNYRTIYGLQRRSTAISSHYTSVVCDFDHLTDYSMCFNVDDVFCCLGTTRKAAGTKEAFKRVDLDYVIACANMAAKQKVKNFVVISAINANPDSMWFYNRVKGEMEQQLVIPFEHSETMLHICRPSLLIGQRAERRIGEQLALYLVQSTKFIWRGLLERYQPINASQLANAMLKLTTTKFTQSVNIHENDELIQLANTKAIDSSND